MDDQKSEAILEMKKYFRNYNLCCNIGLFLEIDYILNIL